MKERKISTIKIFQEKVPAPLENYDHGYHKIDGSWFRDRIEIDGIQPDCPAIDIKEFRRILQAPGDYELFTCTCGNAGCIDIDYPVRCRHKQNLIILVIRSPLRSIVDCTGCKFEKDPERCPADGIWNTCPFRKFHYNAYTFRREDIEAELSTLKGSVPDMGR